MKGYVDRNVDISVFQKCHIPLQHTSSIKVKSLSLTSSAKTLSEVTK